MPSSDRAAPRRDRPEDASAARKSGKARPEHAPAEQPQYFDPTEPWDAEAAEALAQHYESGEGYLHQQAQDQPARHRQARRPHGQAQKTPEGLEENRWIEARLADMAALLQASLTRLNPDKAAEQLNPRLDLIEKRFNDVMERVAQRADLEGLSLIEAQVQELAAHIDESRGQLDRIGQIDDQLQIVARRLDEYDHTRLTALEKLMQDYTSEWRRADERTASALHNLEAVVGRVGEAIEAIEVYKPAPDLSLAMLGEGNDGAVGADPVSQVYTHAARVLEPAGHHPTLDAADYAPQSPSEPELRSSGNLKPEAPLAPAAQDSKPDNSAETSPAPAAGGEQTPKRGRRPFPNLLLAGAVTLFGGMGYLLVDVFVAASVVPRPAQSQRGIPATAGSLPAQASIPETPAQAELGPWPLVKTARIEAIGSAMAATLRGREAEAGVLVQTKAADGTDPKSSDDPAPAPAGLSLPLTIGPASLRQAAMRGEPTAQIEVAARLATGQGVERNLEEALSWYARAAAQGSAIAQYRLGAMYERGLGALRDPERARVWYTRAAEQGNVKAMHNLAVLSVSSGRSDYAAAAKWFAHAAKHGLVDSQVNLAILHQNGLGMPKDLAQAYRWMTLAARGGDAEAGARRDQIKARLSQSEVQAADAEAADWRAQPVNPAMNEMSGSVFANGRP